MNTATITVVVMFSEFSRARMVLSQALVALGCSGAARASSSVLCARTFLDCIDWAETIPRARPEQFLCALYRCSRAMLLLRHRDKPLKACSGDSGLQRRTLVRIHMHSSSIDIAVASTSKGHTHWVFAVALRGTENAQLVSRARFLVGIC